jgi:hypothetical protein
MRLRTTILLTALLVLAVAATAGPAAAASRYKVGIGEQNASMFSDPNFRSLGLKRVRYLVPWDWRTHAGIAAETRAYIAAARAARKELFVTFTASRGCWNGVRYTSGKKRCKPPSAAAYKKMLKAFRKEFPFIKVFAPWNEVNHQSQPTFKRPKLAATYYNTLRANCRGCTIVAADVLDSSNMVGYVKAFRRHAKGTPRIWGMHNYSDVNRRRPRMTLRMLKAVPGQVWLTETGGLVSFGRNWKYNTTRAANRTKYMFALADKYSKKRRGLRSRITRIYPYSWNGERRGARFDAGLVGPDGKPRPAFKVFKTAAKKRSK